MLVCIYYDSLCLTYHCFSRWALIISLYSFVSAEKRAYDAPNSGSGKPTFMTIVIGVIAFIVVGELASIIALESNRSDAAPATIIINNGGATDNSAVVETVVETDDEAAIDPTSLFSTGENVCAGKKPDLPNTDCIVDAMTNVGPQAGGNVTKGYVGGMVVDHVPVTTPYWMNGMCPVNVHWHLGSEHYSLGEYDEAGDGPNGNTFGQGGNDGGEQPGYRCQHYDATDTKFTKEFDWQHCKNMVVGETYEVQYVSTLWLPFSCFRSLSHIIHFPSLTVGLIRLPVPAVLPTNTKLPSMMVSSARTVFLPTLPPRLVSKPRSSRLSMMKNSSGPT